MIRRHDAWSKMGEENLGRGNISWAERCDDGGFMLMKAILNDHWADARQGWKKEHQWDKAKIDYVMSKLYWCWVALLEHWYPQAEPELSEPDYDNENSGGAN